MAGMMVDGSSCLRQIVLHNDDFLSAGGEMGGQELQVFSVISSRFRINTASSLLICLLWPLFCAKGQLLSCRNIYFTMRA